MSEAVGESLDIPVKAVEPASHLMAGTLLRQARESAGLHIAALAVSLKVPVKKLEALEGGRLDLLPDAVFARALASSVCRTLKIDPAPVLASLPQSRLPRLHSDGMAINTPFSTPGLNPRATVWDQLSRPVVIAALALVVGALVLVLLPTVETSVPTRASTPATEVAPSVTPLASVASSAVTLRSVESLSATEAPVGIATSIPAPVSAPVAPPAGLSTSALPAAPNAPVGNDGLVVLTAKSATWVEVIDGGGIVQLRKTLSAGEAIGASGGLPLMVTIGRADATEVQVRGKSFDLAPITKNNVARFEVR